MRFAQDYLKEIYDYGPADPLVVNIRNSSDPADPGVVAYSGGDFLVVYTGSQGWVEASPFDRLHVIVHEYVQVYQFDFAGRGDEREQLVERLARERRRATALADHRAALHVGEGREDE